MSSASSLLRRVKRLERELAPKAKHWVLVVEDGQELTPEQRERIGPHDTVVIRYYPKNYLGFV